MAMRMSAEANPATVIDTCRGCRKPITHAGGNWVNTDGYLHCPRSADKRLPLHEPVTGTPITTPLRELLIAMAEDAAMYRQREDSAEGQAAPDEYDEFKRRLRAARTDAEALSMLAGMAGPPAGTKAAA